ncbi:lamin-B3-like isoform X2 [Montipora capricornis]|uniref:lamin-B3-like isoform X2 n=1 Tax=Montipora capricornis TaxID=246305 RepID=UPI0035F1382E
MTSLPPSDLPPVISPTKQALRFFLEKKEEEFKHLNGRLDVYIKKVKTLEASNSQLTAEKNKLTVEINKLKTSKETEIIYKQSEPMLEDENQLYNKILLEGASIHDEKSKNSALVDEYKKQLDKEIEAHKVTQDALNVAQGKLSEKEGQLVARNQENKNLESKLLEQKKEWQELNDALKQETLLKMKVESKLVAAELVSKKNSHEKVIVEIRRQLQQSEEKRFEVESEMKTRYEEMLARQVQELRNELETSHKSEYYEMRQKYLTAVTELTTVQEQKRTCSMNVENLTLDMRKWKWKCEVLQQMHTKDWEELSSVREENRKLAIDIENLKLQIGQWESKYASLMLKIEHSETLREADNRMYDEIIAQKDELIKKGTQWIVTEELNEELRKVNQMLDSDITDYRRMIEEEEGRLNIKKKGRSSELEGKSETETETVRIEEVSQDYKEVIVIRTDEAASQEITMETSAEEATLTSKEADVVSTDEAASQEITMETSAEEATLTSKEADVVSTDETASQEITMETSAEEATLTSNEGDDITSAEEATLIRKGVHVIRTGEAASQERTMETRTKATSQFYEEVTVIRTDEPGTQEEATFISEEARVTRTDEGTSQEITMETSGEHHPPPSKIQ